MPAVARVPSRREGSAPARPQPAGISKPAPIDKCGRLVNKTAMVKEWLPQEEVVTFSTGDVGWLAGKTGDRRLRLVRVLK